MSGSVSTELRADGAAIVTLNRPDVGNALSMSMANELYATAETLTKDPSIRVLLLRGSGANFCVGGDVTEMAAAAQRGAFLAELAGRTHDALAVLRELAVPIVGAVRGAAAGAGLGLVLACDIVIADETAKFLTAYAGVGLSPDCGVSALLPPVVGVRRAAILALTGRVLTADEAREWGLISEVCAAAELDDRAEQVCAGITAGASRALGEAALLLRAGTTDYYRSQLDRETTTISRLADTAEAAERINRFVARQAERASQS